MKQVAFSAFGQPSVVAQCVDVADVGSPSAWEVVVDVEAFPINPADLATLAGRYGKLPKLPSSIGMEGVGRISELGTSVKTLSIGDRVLILANNNWCERRKVPAAAVHKLLEPGDLHQSAMLKVNPATAWLMMTNFVSLSATDWILQTAPLSGVGRCVLQLAKSRNVRTINVVRRAEAVAEVLAIGGDVALEDGPDLAQRVRAAIGHYPLRLALDAVGGPGVQRLAEALSEGGQIVNYGMLSTENCVLNPEQTIFRGISLVGFWLSKVLNRLTLPERTELYTRLDQLLIAGTLNMAVDSCFPLENLHDALRRAEQGARNGKVIVSLKS